MLYFLHLFDFLYASLSCGFWDLLQFLQQSYTYLSYRLDSVSFSFMLFLSSISLPFMYKNYSHSYTLLPCHSFLEAVIQHFCDSYCISGLFSYLSKLFTLCSAFSAAICKAFSTSTASSSTVCTTASLLKPSLIAAFTACQRFLSLSLCMCGHFIYFSLMHKSKRIL